MSWNANPRWHTLTTVLGAAACLGGSLWYATQNVAWHLGYAPWLGPPWTTIAGWRVYGPTQVLPWYWRAGRVYPAAFTTGTKAVVAGLVGMAVCGVVGSILRRRARGAAATFGSSHWATRGDIRHSGLLAPIGCVLGRLRIGGRQRYLQHAGDQHVLVFAPTGSGKTSSVVIPTLLTLPDSIVLYDIQGTAYTQTAGWRSQFSRVIYYNPTADDSDRHNPLLEIRKGPQEIRDTQNVTDILIDPEGAKDKESRDRHWNLAAAPVISAGILHVLYAEPNKTLAGVVEFFTGQRKSLLDMLHTMLNTKHLGDRVHPFIASVAHEMVQNKTDRDRAGVMSTCMDYLTLYRDPIIARTTSECDFRIADLQDADDPVSLYLVVPPSDISRTKPLIRLLLNQIGRLLTEDLVGNKKRQLTMILDDFPSMGHLEFFESELAFIRAYKIRAMLIAQSLNQLEDTYGTHNAILDNCHIRVIFTANDDRTAKRISELCGTMTELRAQTGYAGRRWAVMFQQRSVSQSEVSRPLITPGEVMQLAAHEALILVGGCPPIRAEKAYFHDPLFQRRLLPVPERPLAPSRPVTHEWTTVRPAAAHGTEVHETTSDKDRSPQTPATVSRRYLLE